MGILKRLFGIGKANANALLDSLEEPIKMTKQGIRDMRENVQRAHEANVKANAQLKGLQATRQTLLTEAESYTAKANSVQDRIESGELAEERGNEALVEALKRIEDSTIQAEKLTPQIDNIKRMVDANVERIKKYNQSIEESERNLITLEARYEAAKAGKEINREMSVLNGNDTVSDMMKRMEKKVQDEESMSLSYEEMNEATKGVSSEVEDILNNTGKSDSNALLEKFKKNRKTVS
jgi:phage shock protein A